MSTPIQKLQKNKWRENYAYNIDEAHAMADDARRHYRQVSVKYVERKALWIVRFRQPR
jgi:hypothetical protein